MSRRGELLGSYLSTTYVVHLPEHPVAIRVGERQPALDALLVAHGAGAWAFVTAHNPASLRVGDDENARRQCALEAELRACNLAFVRGEGIGDDADWLPEASVLVIDISLEDAVALARRHGQSAIVFGVHGGVAELVWCDEGLA